MGFQRDGRVTLLSTDDSIFQADLELGGSLQAFQTEYQGTQASVVVRVDALLIRGYDQRILASRRFEERQPLKRCEGAGSGRRLRSGQRPIDRESRRLGRRSRPEARTATKTLSPTQNPWLKNFCGEGACSRSAAQQS
jgi:hypothetical protein